MPVDAKIAEAYVEMEARMGKLDADLRKAEGKVKKSAKKMEKDSKITLGGIGGAALKLFGALGFVELGFKGISAIAKASRGDIEGMEQALQQLPFGIGPAVQAFSQLRDEVSGVAAAMEELAKAQAKANKEVSQIDARRKQLRSLLDAAESTTQGLDRQRRLVGLGGESKIREENRQRLEDAETQARGLESQGLSEAARDLRDAAKRLGDVRLRQFQFDQARKQDAEARQLEAQRQRDADRERQLQRVRDEAEAVAQSRSRLGRIQNLLGSKAQNFDVARQIFGQGGRPEMKVDGIDDVVDLLRQLVNRNPVLGAI